MIFENIIVEIHDGKVEVKWSVSVSELCSDIRSYLDTKTSILGGPTYCKSCGMKLDCPLNWYREKIESVQRDLQYHYNAGFEHSDKALYHLDKALFYLTQAAVEGHKAWKEKLLLEEVSKRLGDSIHRELESLYFIPHLTIRVHGKKN